MVDQSLRSSLSFDKQVVLITGSGTGIGQAIAKKFAEHGASIIIMGRRKEPLDETTNILNGIIKSVGSSGRVRSCPGVDVSDEEGIKQMFDDIKKEFGKVDILINNAGVSGPVKVFPNANFEDFKNTVAIHLTGTFWTTVQALRLMQRGSKVITIATFFAEERPFEQRPYRFRTPYTLAQGAKNRLSEALAWELTDRGIRVLCTNPGPVHSDRIYKTVYPKAAAEYVRIGGFPNLKPTEIDMVNNAILPLLGEPDNVVNNGINKVTQEILKSRGKGDANELAKTIKDMVSKVQNIAEKIQNNTKSMIVDGEFLSQEDLAELILDFADDHVSKTLHGRVVPADRVFYPVKPLVGVYLPYTNDKRELAGKSVVFTATTSDAVSRVKEISSSLSAAGAKVSFMLAKDLEQSKLTSIKEKFEVDFRNENKVRESFSKIAVKNGKIDCVVHFTGNMDLNKKLSELSRMEWDRLVDQFINIPTLVAKESINVMVPNAVEEPERFKGAKGRIVIVGPDAPKDRKAPGEIKARAEVFRGALRPFTATVNAELDEILGSSLRVYLLLPGSVDGGDVDAKRLGEYVSYLAASETKYTQVIYYPDEAKANHKAHQL